MKQEDFERLKAVCEKEGFELSYDHERCETFNISKKDIWDGVEFARYKFQNHLQLAFFKVKETNGEYLITENGAELFKGNCEPITEQAYIEQLKKEAHERFGEINVGDRFDRTPVMAHWESNVKITPSERYQGWDYRKEFDDLYFNGLCLYKQGKWATKVKERVKVEWKSSSIDSNSMIFRFDIEGEHKTQYADLAASYLASQLEKYLNGEIE